MTGGDGGGDNLVVVVVFVVIFVLMEVVGISEEKWREGLVFLNQKET